MSALSKRLARLEGTNGTEDLVVVIQRFGGAGEYTSVKSTTGRTVERLLKESEEAFLDRARDEIVATTKNEMGPQPCYVMQLLRNGEAALETTPQVRPTVTRDEWLVAHGIKPIDNTAD